MHKKEYDNVQVEYYLEIVLASSTTIANLKFARCDRLEPINDEIAMRFREIWVRVDADEPLVDLLAHRAFAALVLRHLEWQEGIAFLEHLRHVQGLGVQNLGERVFLV